MTKEPNTSAEAQPFELTIPIRVMNQGMVQDLSGVEVIAVGGIKEDGPSLTAPSAVVELRVRTGFPALIADLALGKGFELVLREIATPGPEV